MASIADTRLHDYQPTELNIVCRRCGRHATARTYALKAKYGNPTLGEVARMVAADGNPPCNLASVEGNVLCSVLPDEPLVEQWATLTHARIGGWVGWLQCRRRYASLKSTKSCPGEFRLDVHTLLTTLEWDFPLARLPTRLQCPECGTKAISIAWEVVSPPEPTPSGTLQRPTTQTSKKGLRVVGGGR